MLLMLSCFYFYEISVIVISLVTIVCCLTLSLFATSCCRKLVVVVVVFLESLSCLLAMNLSCWANSTCRTDLCNAMQINLWFLSLPQKIVHMSKKKKEDWNMFWKTDLGFAWHGFLEEQLNEAGPPHDNTGGQGQPLVVGDGLVLCVPHCQRDEDVQGDGDQDWGQEADQEQEKEIVF